MKSIDETTKDLEIMLLIEQWKRLHAYVQEIETGHWKAFTVVIAVFGLSSFGSSNSSEMFRAIPLSFWLTPPAISIMCFYEAHLFRELAILKAYLANLELVINEYTAAKNASDRRFEFFNKPMNWYSRYQIVYSTKGSQVKKHFLIPVISVFVIIYAVFLLPFINHDLSRGSCVCMAYITALIVTAVLDWLAIWNIKNSEGKKFRIFHETETTLSKNITDIWSI